MKVLKGREQRFQKTWKNTHEKRCIDYQVVISREAKYVWFYYMTKEEYDIESKHKKLKVVYS